MVRSRMVAAVQGASYIYFSGWLFLRREEYRRTHHLSAESWLLNAHGGWMLIVGATLVRAAARDRTDEAEVRLLGIGSAVALASNDAVGAVRREVPPIYCADLAWESALATLWSLAPSSRGA